MAVEIPAPAPPPKPEGPVHWAPSPGMAISTLRVSRSQDAFVAVEHPEGWGEAEVLAAVNARLLDLGKKIDWWDADSTSAVEGVTLGENDPDNPHCEPFALGEPEASDEPSDEPAPEMTPDMEGE